MNAVLFSKTGLFAGTSFKIGHDATIGKNDGNTVVLRSDIVSGSHAKITYDNAQNAYILEDLESSNGTQLDGISVKGKEKLERLHVITFAGKFDFIFQVGGAIPVKAETAKSKTVEKAVEKTIMDKAEGKLPSFGKYEPVKEEKTIFDSGQESPSPLPGFGNQPDVHQTVFDKSGAAPAPLPAFGKPKEEPKTVFDSGQDILSPLPSFGKPKEKEEEKTISSPAPQAALPVFQKQPEPKPSEIEARTEVMRQYTTPPPTGNARFALEVGKLNKNFELKDGSTTIGRTIGSDIIIEDVSMSRKHALITVKGDKLTIKDLGSSNGTSVDKKRISSEVEITPVSVIKLGIVDVKIKKVN